MLQINDKNRSKITKIYLSSLFWRQFDVLERYLMMTFENLLLNVPVKKIAQHLTNLWQLGGIFIKKTTVYAELQTNAIITIA